MPKITRTCLVQTRLRRSYSALLPGTVIRAAPPAASRNCTNSTRGRQTSQPRGAICLDSGSVGLCRTECVAQHRLWQTRWLGRRIWLPSNRRHHSISKEHTMLLNNRIFPIRVAGIFCSAVSSRETFALWRGALMSRIRYFAKFCHTHGSIYFTGMVFSGTCILCIALRAYQVKGQNFIWERCNCRVVSTQDSFL